jgi:hypothetical protein
MSTELLLTINRELRRSRSYRPPEAFKAARAWLMRRAWSSLDSHDTHRRPRKGQDGG